MLLLMERDGITVQALSDREEAEYKKLGFTPVEPPPPAAAAAAKSKKHSAAEPPAVEPKAGE